MKIEGVEFEDQGGYFTVRYNATQEGDQLRRELNQYRTLRKTRDY